MNMDEPDAFEQFMTSVRKTGEQTWNGLQWLFHNAEEVAIALAVPIMALAILLVVRARLRRRRPQVTGMRHARR